MSDNNNNKGEIKMEIQKHGEFASHILNEDGINKAKKIAEAFDVLLSTLESSYCDEGRSFSICKTKLEEACFFAKKSMATDLRNQKQD